MIANNGALPLDAVENKFRAHIFAMRIRLVDLFAHFDKLRSGFITASQFRRCIGAAYDKGVVTPLTQAECDILVTHYDVKKNGMVKWRAFADSIDKGIFPCLYDIDLSIYMDRLVDNELM
jgi:Ca2+-binding EF-hand superfamily protein